MDDIEVKEEYDAKPDENFNMGDGDDDDDTNNEANIIQQDVASNIYVHPIMVLSYYFNMDVARDQDMINMDLNET